MTLIELRRKLHDACMEEGGRKQWATARGIAFGYVSAVIRGDAKPGKKILKALGLRKVLNVKKTEEMKFEDITN